MTAVDPDRLAAVRADYAHCFGCGLDNDAGLRIDGFERDGTTVAARFRPGAQHRGFQGVLHGGIVATALDEILAWTAILVARTMAVTATLDLKYRAPAPGGRYFLQCCPGTRVGLALADALQHLVVATFTAHVKQAQPHADQFRKLRCGDVVEISRQTVT